MRYQMHPKFTKRNIIRLAILLFVIVLALGVGSFVVATSHAASVNSISVGGAKPTATATPVTTAAANK